MMQGNGVFPALLGGVYNFFFFWFLLFLTMFHTTPNGLDWDRYQDRGAEDTEMDWS